MKNIFQRLEVHVTHFILWRHVIKWRLNVLLTSLYQSILMNIMTTQWLKYQSCQLQTTSSNPPIACVAYMHFHPLWYLPFYSYIKRFRPVLNSPNLKFACWRQGQRSEIERGVYFHIYIMCFPIPTTPLFFNISLVLKCCWKQTI